MTKKTNFFESVANHNLERFHSETIAWIFNTFQDTAIEFIMNIHPEKNIAKDEIQFKECKAENEQIDIKINYKVGDTEHYIFIENKLKATEHKILHKKWSKDIKDSENKLDKIIKKEDLSQTEYYYFREISKNPPSSCHFIYLIPNRINKNDSLFKNTNFEIEVNGYNFDKLNQWNLNTIIENPWLTITYYKLANWIKSDDLYKKSSEQNRIIAKEYINYILGKKFSEFIDLANFNENNFGQFEYFKLLFALVKSKFNDVNVLNSISNGNKENSIYEYIEAGSSNGGMPLFAFYKKVKLPLGEKFNFFKPKQEFINIGIQVQGENFKYYVSADDYNNTVIIPNKTPNNYGEFVKEILKGVTEDSLITDYVKVKVDFSKYKNNGFNTNKTKSFYSRSYKIKNFIESGEYKLDEIRNIFDVADEISEKVNHFVNFDVSTSIKNFLSKS